MGREVRRVPPNWEHPKHPEGDHIPLRDGFCEAVSRWYREKAMWDQGYRRDWKTDGFVEKDNPDHRAMSYEDWAGEEPRAEDYMPDWAPEICTRLQMYEDTSAGTPISPVCETAEELARWLADNGASAFGSMTATYEQWLATINTGFAVSMVVSDDGEAMSGVAFNAAKDPQ